MVIVELVFLILLGILLTRLQTNISVEEQRGNAKEKIEEMDELVAKAKEASEQTKVSFDEIYKAKAGSAAYMFQNDVLSEYTPENMRELKELLQVDNVLVLDKEGNLLAKAANTPAEFTRSRYNQLRTVFSAKEPSDAFEVKVGDIRNRYYGARIDDNAMLVIEQNPEELDKLLDSTSTWKSILGNVKVGLNGYAFAISDKDYTFLYYPDEELVGKDALSHGISVKNLEDGNYTWMNIDGNRFYCGVTQIDDSYILCAIDSDEILASRNTTVVIILFSFFAVITLVITFAFFLMGDEEKDEKRRIFGHVYFHKRIGKKISVVSLIGLVAVILVSFYMQTLFALSRQSMTNNQRVKEVEDKVREYGKETDQLVAEYNDRYLNKCQIAAYAIQKNPNLAKREKLSELSGILDVISINVFDQNGVQTATDSPYTRFHISQNEEDQSYEFNKLLLGLDHLIQEAQPDEVSGEYHQYIGVTLRDEEQNPDGFVQISILPSKLKETVSNMQIDKILDKIKVGKGGIIFAIDKETQKFVYFPEEKIIGRKALKYGVKKNQLADEYSGYIRLGRKNYYGSSLETDKYYVYAAVPTEMMTGNRLPITVASMAAGVISLAIIILLLTISYGEEEEELRGDTKGTSKKMMVDVVMPDGSVRKTKSAANRWGTSRISWIEKTPEQKMMVVLQMLVGILTFAICAAVILKDKVLGENSIFLYILQGKWERGMNIFSLTSAIMIICVVTVITMLIQNLLRLLSRTTSAKGETICRLLRSFLKYFSVILMMYYCLALIGIDTKTLLASAGILTLVVGLGAQSLVSDILAGLFIIFEGEFQVGDIVTIGDWRGKVVEIGIRTTKIQDGSQNIKIISNSDVCGVVNMTRDFSYAWSDIGIEYGESLERVETILEKEFPNIRRRLPKILDGPFYKGVISLGDNSVNIRVMVLCAESDRIQMERDLNREMKLLFDKYEINIPFPQVVLNQPVEFQKATEWEKQKADEFNRTQKNLTSDLIEDDEDEN